MTAPIDVASYFDSHSRVVIDLWGANPLVEDYAQINAGTLSRARGEAPEPTLFESGDLPPFTASGVNPEVLNRLPYTARHAAAAEPSAAAVLGMIEQYGNDPTIEFAHQGLDEYRQRVSRWLSGFDKPTVEMTTEESDQLMSELFDQQP